MWDRSLWELWIVVIIIICFFVQTEFIKGLSDKGFSDFREQVSSLKDK